VPQAHRVLVMCRGDPLDPLVLLVLGRYPGPLVPRVLVRSLGHRGVGWLAVAAAAAAAGGDGGALRALLCLMLARRLRTAGSMGQGAPRVPGDCGHGREMSAVICSKLLPGVAELVLLSMVRGRVRGGTTWVM
jgi:hypothetical protein